jgi:hypothetical protein
MGCGRFVFVDDALFHDEEDVFGDANVLKGLPGTATMSASLLSSRVPILSAVPEVDHFRSGGNGCVRADGDDVAVRNNHQAKGNQGIILAIEKSSRLQNTSFAGWFWPLPVNPRPEKCSEQK